MAGSGLRAHILPPDRCPPTRWRLGPGLKARCVVVLAPGGVPTEKGVGEPPVWEAGPVGVSALLAGESGGVRLGRAAPGGWGGQSPAAGG